MTADKILDKLAKLKAAQDGEAALGNSAAAEAFAGMINAMLLRHELSMVDVPTGPRDQDPIVEVRVDRSAHGIARSRMRVGWQEALARVVAEAHLCEFLVVRGSNVIIFVGTHAHATVAEHAYGVLCAAAARMSMEARAEWWRTEHGGRHVESGGFRASWLSGFVDRIGERFDEARRTETQATGNASMALVHLNNALTRAADHVKAKYKKSMPATSTGGANAEGHAMGRAAADAMRIGQKAVRNGTARGLLR